MDVLLNPAFKKSISFIGEIHNVDSEIQTITFKHLIFDNKNVSELAAMASNGQLGQTYLRSIFWRISLGLLPVDETPSKWVERLESMRAEYLILKKTFDDKLARSENEDPQMFNPLSNHPENPWNALFEYTEYTKQIEMDIDRTFPDQPFFQDQKIRSILCSVLFLWSQQHPETGYRQGMNDLAAVFLYTLVHEIPEQRFTDTSDIVNLLTSLNNRDHAEADTYYLFTALMEKGWETIFRPIDTAVMKRRGQVENTFGTESGTEISNGCNSISHQRMNTIGTLLNLVDAPLFHHLDSQDVHHSLYVLKWIKLIFCREFHLADIQTFWDAIFADQFTNETVIKATALAAEDSSLGLHSLPLINTICVAMILVLKTQLINGDNSTCLRRLMKYPPIEKPFDIIKCARDLKNCLTVDENGHFQASGELHQVLQRYLRDDHTPRKMSTTSTSTSRKASRSHAKDQDRGEDKSKMFEIPVYTELNLDATDPAQEKLSHKLERSQSAFLEAPKKIDFNNIDSIMRNQSKTVGTQEVKPTERHSVLPVPSSRNSRTDEHSEGPKKVLRIDAPDTKSSPQTHGKKKKKEKSAGSIVPAHQLDTQRTETSLVRLFTVREKLKSALKSKEMDPKILEQTLMELMNLEYDLQAHRNFLVRERKK
mmetsp:Transcript_47050/g.54232  ORF Transcript_47050/g.54232 Transcript_47050/m.54232 type:complete len:653 (+) Transcript_47050:40-1998(+)